MKVQDDWPRDLLKTGVAENDYKGFLDSCASWNKKGITGLVVTQYFVWGNQDSRRKIHWRYRGGKDAWIREAVWQRGESGLWRRV